MDQRDLQTLMTGCGTELPICDVRVTVAIGGKVDLQQGAPDLRRRFTLPRQGEPRLTRCSASATVVAAPVLVSSAVAIPTSASTGFVTAECHGHPSHRGARSICDLFKISSINSLPINNHHRLSLLASMSANRFDSTYAVTFKQPGRISQPTAHGFSGCMGVAHTT
jgi:hypothetical protein